MTYAMVVQHCHQYTVNGVMFERWMEYELKFGSNDFGQQYYKDFCEHYNYSFDLETRKGPEEVPEGFSCWCDCFHLYLMENGFHQTGTTDKFFLFEKV